jgi:nucleoside-diphosphate-sugar epimerase
VTAIVGDLSVPVSYAATVEECDVIVHTAKETEKNAAAIDRLSIYVFVAAARARARAGRSTTFVYTSGAWVLGDTAAAADEEAPLHPPAMVEWRPAHEQLVLNAADGALRTVVIRPGIVYGGARGIVGDLLKAALNGLVRVVGDGRNHWPCVYERDLADLYLRVVNDPSAGGLFHANDEADETVIDIVDAIAGHARMRPDVRHVPLTEARAKLGPYADALALDQIVRSPRARAIGWNPTLHSVAGNVARLLEEFRSAQEAA